MISLRCFIKIFGVVLVASLVIFKLNAFSQESKTFFIEKNKIVKGIDEIKHSELMLDYTVSASSLYLYKNNDTIIKAVKELEKNIDEMIENKTFQNEYSLIYGEILEYKKLIEKKIEYVYEFQSYNSAIKNSTMYLAMLLQQFSAVKRYKPSLYKKKFVEAISTIFLSKNSIEKDLVKNIDVDYFNSVDLHNDRLNRLNQMFTAHLRIFQKYYPKYNRVMLAILDPKTKDLLTDIDSKIYKISTKKLEDITYTLYVLIGFITLFTLFVISLIIKSERENIALNDLTQKLQENMRIDNLTQLFNRLKYDEDMQQNNFASFYLVNIDKFKYINDYYGTKIGDKVLQKVATVLNDIIKNNADLRLYRLGSDDFGILTVRELREPLEMEIFQYFEKNEINVGDFQFKISISIAYTEEKPFFENANMALKKIKSSSRIKFLQYSKAIDNKAQILQNIEKTKVLYNALENERLVPYFQGIVDVKSGKIAKYEVLSRVVNDDGRIESIFPYLQIAKDNKLYSKITKTILYKSVELFSKNDIAFNINFSIEDIMDDSIIAILNTIATENPKVMQNITFEILESESINDYNAIKTFIEDMKKLGAKVAIDDFGSGYSNFEHLINLDIDFIKIDGSLIKNVHIDKSAYNIVNLINKFAHESNIQTVGEFVENEEIYKTLQEIGIDYAQGYYFAKPEENIVPL